MSKDSKKQVDTLVVDTTAFIQNASLHEIAENMVTCQEVVDEITNKRQLRRLVVLPYDLKVKDVFAENIKIITDFAKKTGDYPSLSATDIKVMALTYQLEKEKVGTEHLRSEPVLQRPKINTEKPAEDLNPDLSGFYIPGQTNNTASDVNEDEEEEIVAARAEVPHDELAEKFGKLQCEDEDLEAEEDVLVAVDDDESCEESEEDDDVGWIKPSNVKEAKKQVNSQLMEQKRVEVACMTTDFAMQNVLRQMNLNVSALDGRIIKQLRTYILRCYACFKTTSLMTKRFCPKCGNNTLKKVAVSVDENGEMQIHINPRRPLSGKGKRISLPRVRGGKHPNNPILVEDQPMADNKPSRLAKMKNNPMDDDYIAGFSPFIMRDVYSKSAQLGIRPGVQAKQWTNSNVRRKRK